MKVRKGWLTSLNEDTKKMIPFFVNVRSEDIIPTNPIDLSAVCKQTSTRWKLMRTEDRVDITYYHYEASWTSKTDANAEVVGSDLMDGYIDYFLHKDGRFDIDGVIRASGSYEAIDSTYGKISSYVYLPFAFEEVPIIQTSYAFGDCANITLGSKISTAKITNQKLNLNNVDNDDYLFLLTLTGIVPVNDTIVDVIPLEKIRNAVESNAMYANADYLSYIRSYFPYRIKYSGFWRTHESSIVDTPKSFLEDYNASYYTIAPVNMYVSADKNSTRIRTLSTNTNIRCYGYYTIGSDNVVYLLCQYTPTSQTGFVPLDYITKK